MQIIIDSNSKTSDKDVNDLKSLLEELRGRYNFNWHENTYVKDTDVANSVKNK